MSRGRTLNRDKPSANDWVDPSRNKRVQLRRKRDVPSRSDGSELTLHFREISGGRIRNMEIERPVVRYAHSAQEKLAFLTIHLDNEMSAIRGIGNAARIERPRQKAREKPNTNTSVKQHQKYKRRTAAANRSGAPRTSHASELNPRAARCGTDSPPSASQNRVSRATRRNVSSNGVQSSNSGPPAR
jgi:hypothetical protein